MNERRLNKKLSPGRSYSALKAFIHKSFSQKQKVAQCCVCVCVGKASSTGKGVLWQ